MTNNVFYRRLMAAVIDFTIIFIAAFCICAWLSIKIFTFQIDQQMAPFVVIEILTYPLSFVWQICTDPQAFGNSSIFFLFLAVSFFLESIFYTVFELFPSGRTPGFALMNIRIVHSTPRYRTLRIVLRNLMKTLSRYFFCIPFILSVFNKGITFYDSITKVLVVRDA